MRKRMGILAVLLAAQLSTRLALACSCAPQVPPRPGVPPTLRLPRIEHKDASVFLGVVEDVYPKSVSDIKNRWRQRYGEELSEDKPPTFERMREFMLYFWDAAFSPEEQERMNQAHSVDELESAIGSFWMTPRRVRFKITEIFAGPKTVALVLYTGFGNGDCGVDFQAGENWLVDAYRDDAGRWIAGACSVTMPEKEAGALLTALRARTAPKQH